MRRAGLPIVLALVTVACHGRGAAPRANPEDAYRANNVGIAQLEQFKYDDAAVAFRRALAIAPGLGAAHLNLSIALFLTQDLAGAAREAGAAAVSLTSSPEPPYLLGLVARAEQRNEDAARFFRRVLDLDPGDAGALVNLAQVKLQGGAIGEAQALLRTAIAGEPSNVTAVYTLGLALVRAGQRAEGERVLRESQQLRASGYALSYGNQYLEQGRYAEAIASTGVEPDLIETTSPVAHWTPATVAGAPPAHTDPAPFGRRFAPTLTADTVRAIATGLGGAVTPIDIDRDGHLDLFISTADGERLLRNDGHGTFADVTAASGLGRVPPGSVPVGAIAADVDNDGAPDLFVLRYGTSSLYRNDGGGRFTDVTVRAGLSDRAPLPGVLPGAAAFVDVDHDGDLDLVIAGLVDFDATRLRGSKTPLLFPQEFAPAPLRLWRNNGNGTFTDITREAGLLGATHALAIVPTDFDNRRDVDLLVVNHDAPPRLFQNLRDGTFRNVAVEVGLAGVGSPGHEILAVAAGDINQDGFQDLFFGGAQGGLFALSTGRGRFTLVAAPDMPDVTAARFVDYDNDGLLDLLAWTAEGPKVFRRVGRSAWDDVTSRAAPERRVGDVAGGQLAVADLDGDGHVDLMTTGGSGWLQWRNSGDPRHRSLQVRLSGRVSNRLGIGSKIQLRAGSLGERFETSAASPPVVPADVIFGLGTRSVADVVRVLWPSGVLQAEPVVAAASSLAVLELNRKPSSCPFLFAWNGTRFDFVTDFMGGGEMGFWEGPGAHNHPSPVEYVRIRGDQLQPKDGRYELRVTTELEETLFADRLQLIAVSHPAGVDVFPNEGLSDPPKPFHLFAVQNGHVPSRVVDDDGRDVTSSLATVDRRYADTFALAPFRGFAARHSLTLDADAGTLLLLTGWTDYAFSSDNVAAHQAGLTIEPPSLAIKTTAGIWRTAIPDIGMPVGRPQTIVVDLAPLLRAGEHEVRITTNLRVYWDQILIARPADPRQTRLVRMDARTASLSARGFSAEQHPGGTEPATYDYARATTVSPWKAMPGRYTRLGDVRALLARPDDMFVIAKPGDEIALSFDAAAAGPLPEGWARTFLLLADGFSKEMDINSASPDTVEPLPFHRMTQYPYRAPEHYPDTPGHTRYLERDNTRTVIRQWPSIGGPLPK